MSGATLQAIEALIEPAKRRKDDVTGRGRHPVWPENWICYRRIEGALSNLGHKLARSTIAAILERHGMEPAPERRRKTTCLNIVHERRCSGETVSMPDAQALNAEKRKLTLGPLIESCTSRKIIRQEDRARFETFKIERLWLVHLSMIENGDDLYHETTRNAVFNRIAAIQEEARLLGCVMFQDLQTWVVSHGVDLDTVNNQAANAIRKLKGN